jgi:hypothetical protein
MKKSLVLFLTVLALVLPIASLAQVEHLTTTDGVQVTYGANRGMSESIAPRLPNMVHLEARHCQAYASTIKPSTLKKIATLGFARSHTRVDTEACADDPSTLFWSETNHNLRTDAGSDAQASQMGNTSTQAAACNYIALTNTAITPGAAHTTLSGEISTNGLGRAQGAYAHTNGTALFTISKVFTASGAQSAQAAGLFNASSTGTLCFENTFTAASLLTNDTLSIVWTVNY